MGSQGWGGGWECGEKVERGGELAEVGRWGGWEGCGGGEGDG